MKPLPIKRISALVDLFVEACTKQPHAEVEIEITGSYTIDKEGGFGLAALAEGDLPTELPIDVKVDITGNRKFDSQGLGQFKMRLYRPDYTKYQQSQSTGDI